MLSYGPCIGKRWFFPVVQKLFIWFLCTVLVCSCGSSRKMARDSELARMSDKLGIKVERRDNLQFYREATEWLGVPYRYGRNTRFSGVDCSGFVYAFYQKVYGITLERTAEGMYKKNCRKVSRGRLKSGDLVFFNTAKTKRSISHVGIFLKDGIFIHATTHSGVRVSRMDEKYYKERWIGGGKVKKTVN